MCLMRQCHVRRVHLHIEQEEVAVARDLLEREVETARRGMRITQCEDGDDGP